MSEVPPSSEAQRSFAVYMPMDRRQALARGETLPDRAQGAVLLADVSGSTPLMAALVQEFGPQRGAEELTHHLSQVYGALIAEVHRYHGSVITFAGDAIICWFDQDKGPQATACALAMQQAMAHHASVTTPAGTAIPFGIKIAVTAGTARRFLVGNPQIQVIDVLAGAMLDRLSTAEQQLHTGEVVLGAEILGWLGNLAQFRSWRTTPHGENFLLITGLTQPIPPAPWPELPPLDPAATRAWVFPIIGQHLEREEGISLAELRMAIPCFLKFSGIDYDHDDEASAKLDAFTRWVQAVLAHYEGYLVQLTMGDKGNCMYILFGAPVSHEDDPTRAVAAAMELRAPPTELSFIQDIRIGISQGQMYVGAYGGPTHRVYAGLGYEVNLTSRLMSLAAPGQVLVSQRIADAAAGYTFTALGETQLKGILHPVTVFAASGGQRRRIGHLLHGLVTLPMVGREAERAALRELLQNLENGQSGCCIIDGEAGIGKSRLVEDLQEQAQTAGIVAMVGAGDAVEHTTAYYAWRPVFRALFGLEEGQPYVNRDELQRQVSAYVQGDAALVERLPLLNAVLPLNLPDNELTAQMAGEVRAENTRDALTRLLQRAQRESAALLLILEDAHWLDSASWGLLADIRQHVSPLLVVLVTRPLVDTVPAEYEQLRSAEGTRCLHLEALSQDDALAMVCQRLGARELAPDVAALVYQKAEGHPFFSEELAYALRDAGLLEIDEHGICCLSPQAGDASALVFPDTVQGVITSRIDRLPPAHQATLKVASVIGRIFAFRTLRDIHPVEADRLRLADYLDNLEHLDITLRQSPPPDLKYIFKHNITQEVAYSLMLFAQRRELHQRVALWYEQTFGEDLAPFYPLLAYHWTRAEDTVRALDYLEKAGQQALQNYANEEASAFFSQALDMEARAATRVDPVRRGLWELQLGEAYVNQSRFAESQGHLVQGLAALGHPVPTGKVRPALRLVGQLLQQVSHRLRPRHYVGRLADQKEPLQAMARACEKLAEVYLLYANDMALTAYAVFFGLNAAESSGPCPELARGYASIGAMMGLVSLHRYARSYLQRALGVAQTVDNLFVQGYVALSAGYYYAGIGNWNRAEELWNGALEIFDRLGDPRFWETVMAHLANVAQYRGNFARGLELAEAAYPSARHRNDIYYQLTFQRLKIICLAGLGRLEEATACLESVYALLAELNRTFDTARWDVYGGFLAVHLQRAEYEKVRGVARQMEELAVGTQVSLYDQLHVHVNLTDAYLALWEIGHPEPGLAKLADKACRALEKYAQVFPIGRPHAWLCRGRSLWLSGRKGQAQQLWRKSLAAAVQLALPYDEGLAHHEIGRHLEAGQPERTEHLQQAVEIFRRLGAAPALERAQAALERSANGPFP